MIRAGSGPDLVSGCQAKARRDTQEGERRTGSPRPGSGGQVPDLSAASFCGRPSRRVLRVGAGPESAMAKVAHQRETRTRILECALSPSRRWATRGPRSMISTTSTVCATSASRWLETSTVPSAAAKDRIRPAASAPHRDRARSPVHPRSAPLGRRAARWPGRDAAACQVRSRPPAGRRPWPAQPAPVPHPPGGLMPAAAVCTRREVSRSAPRVEAGGLQQRAGLAQRAGQIAVAAAVHQRLPCVGSTRPGSIRNVVVLPTTCAFWRTDQAQTGSGSRSSAGCGR